MNHSPGFCSGFITRLQISSWGGMCGVCVRKQMQPPPVPRLQPEGALRSSLVSSQLFDCRTTEAQSPKCRDSTIASEQEFGLHILPLQAWVERHKNLSGYKCSHSQWREAWDHYFLLQGPGGAFGPDSILQSIFCEESWCDVWKLTSKQESKLAQRSKTGFLFSSNFPSIGDLSCSGFYYLLVRLLEFMGDAIISKR